MLSPDDRSLVTALLTPPPGMVLDAAIATTFTLDPLALLTVPLHLAWLATGQDQALLADGIRLLEAFRRVADCLTVYADRGRIHAPSQAHPLYSLLEPMIVEVRAPGGGAFHPKLWVLRFIEPNAELVQLRLGVLSRNLTFDQSWDLALQLDGTPTGKYIAANRELGEFVRDLPTFAASAISVDRVKAAATLGDELRRTPFDLPTGWSEVGFHVLGRQRRKWSPPWSTQMAVISPFLTAGALDTLCSATAQPSVLISRPDSLAALSAEQRGRFTRCCVLHDAAESEDGEENASLDTLGLHAKALILRSGWDTKLFVGSTNATTAALEGHNLEVWAELTGKRSQVGGINELLGDAGLGSLLVDFDPTTPVASIDSDKALAEKALEDARATLIRARLGVRCEPDGDSWLLLLTVETPLLLGGVAMSAWPLSVREEHAAACAALAGGTEVPLGRIAAADITGMTGFVLQEGKFVLRFALNLPIEGLPAERDQAIVRRVILNRDGFLRYLLLLLGDLGDGGSTGGRGDAGLGGWGHWGPGVGATLLEELVRAFSRDHDRLTAVKRLVERLTTQDGGEPIIPPEFISVWDVFQQALGEQP